MLHMASIVTTDFGAERAELWLWDETSNTGYLTHEAGAPATHRHNYISAGVGPLGKIIQQRHSLMNLQIDGAEKFDITAEGTLAYVSALPLIASGKILALLACYTSQPATPEVLQWWMMYAEVAGIAAQRTLTAVESQKQIKQLSLLFEATRLLNSTLDLAELLDLILRIAKAEVKADRGTVFVADRERRELLSIVAQGLESQEIRVPFGRGVAGKVVESGEIINVADAYTLEYFDKSYDAKFGYRTQSLLCLPIRHRSNEIVGVIQLLNHRDGRFTVEDQEFLLRLSGHMAMALENARLHREALEKQRLERDLAVARQIQRSLLPQAPPKLEGYDIAVCSELCPEVGGDYYDFLTPSPQTLLLVIADVEGKGVGSALVVSNLQATLRALVMHLHSLEVLMLSLNEMIFHDRKSEKYFSCFLGLVDTNGNKLHYINAGHCPPMLVRGKDSTVIELERGGPVVGMFPDSEYRRGTVQLEPGDVLVCYTDGISEASNEKEDEYGKARLFASILKNRALPAQAMVDAVMAEVKNFSSNGSHRDDKVLVIVKVSETGRWEQASGKS